MGTTALAALIHGRKAVGAEIMPEYVEVAKKRIRQAQEGSLRIRPIERSVYDPGGNSVSVPPKSVQIKGLEQARLFETTEEYNAGDE